LVTAIGAALVTAASQRRYTPEAAVLAAGSAAALAAIETTYVARRTISPIYLLDALAEVCLVASWISVLRERSRTDGDHHT